MIAVINQYRIPTGAYKGESSVLVELNRLNNIEQTYKYFIKAYLKDLETYIHKI